MKAILISSVLALSVSNCMAWQENPTHHYSIYVDSNFSDEQANTIMSSAVDWEKSSGGFVRFNGTTSDTGDYTISFYATTDITADCGSDGSPIGCQQDDGIKSHIYMPTNVSDMVFFQQISGHELGHALGMPHIQPGNLLCADRGCAALTVQCGDIQTLSKVWQGEFDPSTLPICKGK